mgnify:CR=1 FL=1
MTSIQVYGQPAAAAYRWFLDTLPSGRVTPPWWEVYRQARSQSPAGMMTMTQPRTPAWYQPSPYAPSVPQPFYVPSVPQPWGPTSIPWGSSPTPTMRPLDAAIFEMLKED